MTCWQQNYQPMALIITQHHFRLNYLTNRKQRTKIGQVYSPWDEITSGVPQGSILGPLIFNIDLCDMFFTLNNHEIAS